MASRIARNNLLALSRAAVEATETPHPPALPAMSITDVTSGKESSGKLRVKDRSGEQSA
jgi:hypothetical protein